MSMLMAVVTALVQGVTELFPISSLGHAVLMAAAMGIDIRAPEFVPFLVVLHLGTVVALLSYFWRDWIGILTGIFAAPSEHRDFSRKLLFLMVVATIPAVILGGVFNHMIKGLFSSPAIAAGFLFVNGFVLFIGERLKRSRKSQETHANLNKLTWKAALNIGLFQCLALLPGISRSGATMIGGLLNGLDHRASAHFSFLIATPIIIGASVLEIPHLLKQTAPTGMLEVSIIAGVVAGVTAYASIAFLMHYFRKHEFEALDPFAYYCWAAGGAGLVYLLAF